MYNQGIRSLLLIEVCNIQESLCIILHLNEEATMQIEEKMTTTEIVVIIILLWIFL